MSIEPTQIGIAVVEHDERFLVGMRKKGSPLAGKAEFPGGKCLPKEAPEDCAVRECREETGLRVRPVRLLDERTFEYSHGIVNLHFWLCEPLDVNRLTEDHRGFRWISRAELKTLDFPRANAALVEILAKPCENRGSDDPHSLDG